MQTREQAVAEAFAEEKAAKESEAAREIAQTDALLGVLRKHGVSEYNGARFTVKFAPQLPMHWALASAPEPTGKTEPALPEPSAVEPQQFDIEDVLFGAK